MHLKMFPPRRRLYFLTSPLLPSGGLLFRSHTVVASSKSQQQANDLLSGLCKQKRFREALDALDSSLDHRLYPSTYAHLFLACSRLKSLRHARLLHRHLSASGPPPDVILCNHILNCYGKCGSLDDARALFDAMPERNLVSWASMISGCVHNRRDAEAARMFLGLLRAGLRPDGFALGSAVRACSGLADAELGRQMHCHAVKWDCGSDRIVQNALVTVYANLDMIDDASAVFERIADKDAISWGAMIAGFAQQGRELEALQLLREVIRSGVHQLNEFHLGSGFTACRNMTHIKNGEQLHGLCVKFGLERDEFAGCSLSDMYARCGNLNCAKRAFDDISMPDLVSWNSMISAFASEGLVGEALSSFSEMRYLGLQPDEITVRCLLCGFTSHDSLLQALQIHSYIVKMGFNADVAVCNSLLSMYARCSDLPTTLDLFKEMNYLDLISWNSVLNACLRHQQPEEVFRLLKFMCDLDCEMDRVTLNSVLNACADLGYLEMANQVHAYALKAGLETDSMVRNSLIDTYAKCGTLDDARKLFNLICSKPDVFTWSSLIVGYAQFGYAKESLELFTTMQNLGILPSHVTFMGVLTACSRVGLVDEGLHYYHMMETQFGIAPTREHCSCIVDLLARAGRLTEAEEFMGKMKFEPDIVMWKTLLSACRLHGNLEIGRRAAEAVLKIDATNSAAYILLCNIYASSHCWDEFANLRKMMKVNYIKKSPGKSWIKVKGEVNVFTVEDWSHPESTEIHLMVELLGLETEAVGYYPKLLLG